MGMMEELVAGQTVVWKRNERNPTFPITVMTWK